MARKVLLVCGIFSSLFYFGMNIFVPMQWADYSSVSQTVSELSDIDAPTRSLLVWLSTPYTLLVVAFAWGVWKSAAHNHALRVSAGLLIAYAGLGLLLALFPMDPPEGVEARAGKLS